MIDPGQARRGNGGGTEPSLDELLSDRVATALMRADRVTVEDVRRAVSTAREGLNARGNHMTPSGTHNGAAPGERYRAIIPALALLDGASPAERRPRRDQVVRLQAVGAAEVAEVGRMLARIGLGAEALPLPVRVDLHLTCAGCTERPRCRSWLAAGEADDGYRLFCPNASMFDRLRHVQQWREAPLQPTGNPQQKWVDR